MKRLRAYLNRSLAIALLPLSMIPFGLFMIGHGPHGANVRLTGGSTPWPAPNVMLTADALKFKPQPAFTGAIPVLLFHGVDYAKDFYTVTPKAFARDLAFLQHLGYHSISVYQYTAWHEGRKVSLPSKPILITFDDARFDSYRGADRILAKYHMQATIYVIVGQVEKHNLFYLKWDELRRMQNSGRWDIQFHAYYGHTLVPFGQGRYVPFYGAREYINGHRETFAQYTSRVTNDIDNGMRILARHGWHSATMAMPFGEYGQDQGISPDPAVRPYLARVLSRRFGMVMVQSGHTYTPYSGQGRGVVRYELHDNSTLYDLYHFLQSGDPAAIARLKVTCARYYTFSIYQGATCKRPVHRSTK